MKYCKKCGSWREETEFNFRSRSTGVRRPECKTCSQKYQHPRRKAAKLKQRYDMTLEGWQALASLQKHRCAVCEAQTTLVVDHDHVTGHNRALLCPPCNLALGLLKEDPERIKKLADYAAGCVDRRLYRLAFAEGKKEERG